MKIYNQKIPSVERGKRPYPKSTQITVEAVSNQDRFVGEITEQNGLHVAYRCPDILQIFFCNAAKSVGYKIQKKKIKKNKINK